MYQLLAKPPRRKTPELNIVPVLDAMTAVIFFLLVSTSFYSLSQITLPRVETTNSEAQGSDRTLPTPELSLTPTNQSGVLRAQVVFAPLQFEALPLAFDMNNSPPLLPTSRERLVNELMRIKIKYPQLETLKLSLAADMPYQLLISVMDVTRGVFKDPVLMEPR